MALHTIIATDQDASAMDRWQLLRTPSTALTAMTAARLAENFYDTSGDREFIDVSAYGSILVQAWGVASDNHDGLINLVGYPASGPGHHFANVTATFSAGQSAANTGFHASANAHPSIKAGFAASQAYNGCDAYALTNDYTVNKYGADTAGAITELQVIVPTSFEADFPAAGFVINFGRSRFKFLSACASQFTGATNLGCIFRALTLRD